MATGPTRLETYRESVLDLLEREGYSRSFTESEGALIFRGCGSLRPQSELVAQIIDEREHGYQ